MLDALRHLQFRLLWTGSLFSYAGQWINQVALGWIAYDITGSGAVVGLILGVRAIPILLLAPLSGHAADHVASRTLLAASGAVNAVMTIALGVALALGVVHAWHLFAFVVATGASQVFDRTTRATAIQDLVPREAIMNAVALNTVAFGLMRVLSPALAGYLIAWFRADVNFFVQGALYLCAIGIACFVQFPPKAPQAARPPLRESVAEGLRFVRRDRVTRDSFLLTGIPFFFLVPVWSTLMPLYAKDVFHAGPEGLGWLYTAIGAGALGGGLAAAALSRVERLGRLQIGSTGVFVLALAGLAASPTLVIAMPFVALASFGEMVSLSVGQAIIQMSAPPEMRGRILSLLQFNPALVSLGSVFVGLGADALGPRGVTAVALLGAFAACTALLVRAPYLRVIRRASLGA